MDGLLPAGVQDPVLVWVMCGRIEHPAVILKQIDEHHVHVRWHSNGTESTVSFANVRYDTGGRGRKRRQSAAAAAPGDNKKDDSAQKRKASLKSRQELLQSRKRRKQVKQSKQEVKHQSAAAAAAVDCKSHEAQLHRHSGK